jgi:hypothetical protein
MGVFIYMKNLGNLKEKSKKSTCFLTIFLTLFLNFQKTHHNPSGQSKRMSKAASDCEKFNKDINRQ